MRRKDQGAGKAQTRGPFLSKKEVPEPAYLLNVRKFLAAECRRNPTYGEAWRRECEARYVLSKPRAERGPYLLGVEEKRGARARAELEQAILVEWKKKAPSKGG
jgi:hypothetical protein